MIVETDRTAIRVLRARSVRPEQASPLGRAVSRLDLRPTGLGSDAILCVRYLQAPGARITLDGGDARLPHAWQQQVREELESLARGAARPARGPVPRSAAAVLFADRAEMLACLAADWLAGVLSERWWWHGLLRGAEPSLAVRREWLDAPRCVPAAVEWLHERGQAVPFVRAVADIVPVVLERVVHTFLVPNIVIPPAEVIRRTHAPVQLSPVDTSPWSAWAPEIATADLTRVEALLLGIALGVRRMPARVRSARFAREVEVWLATVVAPRSHARTETLRHDVDAVFGAPAGVHYDYEHPTEVIHPLQSQQAKPPFVRDVAPEPDHVGLTPPRVERSADRISVEEFSPVAAHTTLDPVVHVDPEPRVASVPTLPVSAERSDTTPPKGISPVRAPGTSVAESLQIAEPIANAVDAPPDVTETARGGALFLINVALAMGFYADFANPVATNLRLPIWDWVALIGDSLLAGALREDPLWMLLARLSRNNAAHWHRPAGKTRFARRIARQVAAVRARLVLTLTPEPDISVEHLLIDLHARITLTPTRLDAAFALDDLPIEIRRVGLDRDPGWVPAAGRTVAFHFD